MKSWWANRARRALVVVSAAALLPLVSVTAAQAQRPGGGGGAPQHPAASAAVPAITGPVNGAPDLAFANYSLPDLGYTVREFFVSGTATSYTSAQPLDPSGNWTVTPGATAPYTTRVIVVAPSDTRRFSGNVMTEWLNVSTGADGAPEWLFGHEEIVRNGDIYVAVSAQAVGVNALKGTNPGRYGTLNHPGDAFSYDIYSQAGMAVRTKWQTLLGAGLQPAKVLAAGESQSGFRMTTYYNAVAPLVNVYDAYMIHSRGGAGAPLGDAPPPPAVQDPLVVPQNGTRIRQDGWAPVLTFETETDLVTLGYLPARQDDTNLFRLWEVAGTAHADVYIIDTAFEDNGSWAADLDLFAALRQPPSSASVGGFTLNCTAPINASQHHYVFQAAWQALIDWARTGRAPQSRPRLDVDTSVNPPVFGKDAVGNVLGGIRTPAVDAPLAVLSGIAPAGGSPFCRLFGQTTPLSPTQVSALYPTQRDFQRAWVRATGDAERAGDLLREDADSLRAVVGG